jgi:N-glycosylase/DNA lyase
VTCGGGGAACASVRRVTQVRRAKFVVESARIVRESGGNDWLLGLRQLPYEEVRDKLLQLMGVGRKVADCVALFSLDKTDAVPVDTHVWDITQSLYAQHLQKTTKSLTPKMFV